LDLSKKLNRGSSTFEEFRPPGKISVLFVGESAPHAGTFFYSGGNGMLSHMKAALGFASASDAAFLAQFKSWGWFLDDLVRTPVDQLDDPERKQVCRAAVADLARRIAQYEPEVVIVLLKGIAPQVAEAVRLAGCRPQLHNLPFPGNGWQVVFREQLARLAPSLPRNRTLRGASSPA
jgi:hypothetical protein